MISLSRCRQWRSSGGSRRSLTQRTSCGPSAGESLALLDSLTASIFLHIFGDPVTNSMGWDSTVLGLLGTLDRGMSRHRPRNAPELLGGPYPLVQTGDVANSGGYITRYSSTYSEIGLRQSRMWPAGTLCITIAANIAKTGLLTFEACFPEQRRRIHLSRAWDE